MATTTRVVVKAALPPRPHPDISGLRRIAAGLAPILLLYVVYSIVRWLVADRGPVIGAVHAAGILRLERWLGIDHELGLQRAVLDHHWLTLAANWYYVYGFLPVLVSCAVIGAWKAPREFQRWRRTFAISMVLALLVYAVYPLTPPRLLPANAGYVDTLLQHGPQYYGDETGSSLFNLYGSIPSTVNVYAAMPSMHVAWSIVAAALFVTVAGRRRWALVVATLHPLLMTFAVIATANHYVLDVVVGVLVLVVAILMTHLWFRVRPGAPAARRVVR